MATSAHNFKAAQMEPPTRIITREVPNLRNPAVAADYRRQRVIINSATEKQTEEMKFWESLQTHEGWV